MNRPSKFYYEGGAGEGWILWAGFTDHDAFDSLLLEQVEEFRRLGVNRVRYSPFTPNYFLPGVDRDNYPELYGALHDLGFRTVSTAIAMSKDLAVKEEVSSMGLKDIQIEFFENSYMGELLDFIRSNFNSDWYYRAENVAANGENEQICLAISKGRIVGYSMFSGPEGKHWTLAGERFGPFGVREDLRGKGIGQALLGKTLHAMKARGIKSAYFLWTDEKASHLYSRFGFQIKREFDIMELNL